LPLTGGPGQTQVLTITATPTTDLTSAVAFGEAVITEGGSSAACAYFGGDQARTRCHANSDRDIYLNPDGNEYSRPLRHRIAYPYCDRDPIAYPTPTSTATALPPVPAPPGNVPE
jgi:hypothetical protein